MTFSTRYSIKRPLTLAISSITQKNNTSNKFKSSKMSFSYSFFIAALLVLVTIDALPIIELPIQDTAKTLDNDYDLTELVRQKRLDNYPPWSAAAVNGKVRAYKSMRLQVIINVFSLAEW